MQALTIARTARCLRRSATPPRNAMASGWRSFCGLDPAFVAGVHGSGGVDQMQARAMQTALWPATFGYWMDTLFTPNPGTTSIFSDNVIEETRAFFTSFVSGRGPLPAIRIGGQPYGILPVTAFSRIQWYQTDDRFRIALSQNFLGALYNLLRKIDADWTTMSQNAAFVGKAGDPHQTLLDILALNPSSVEYYSRNAESLAQLFNMLNRFALGPALVYGADEPESAGAGDRAAAAARLYAAAALARSAESLLPDRQSADHDHH